MSRITWIIIVLIVISILVTVSEVVLRFALLSSRGRVAGSEVVGYLYSMSGIKANRFFTAADFTAPQLEAICGMPMVGKTFAALPF